MTNFEIEQAYRLFWLVKGHLNASHETITSSYDSYFRRLWGNCERAGYGMEGFEEAYEKCKTMISSKKQ